MSILAKLGGRRRLVGNPLMRNIARAAVRANLIQWTDVAEAFRGVFRIRACGVSAYYRLSPGDTIGELLYWHGLNRFESNTLPVFIKLARTAARVLDIGSHTGLYTILACGANPSTKVYAWEPVSSLVERLRDNIALNGFSGRCEVREAAISILDGEGTFHISDDLTMSSLSGAYASWNSHSSREARVRLERLDSVLAPDNPIDLIKIDVEGHEFEALAGAVITLKHWHPKIIFECLPTTAPEPLESFLRGLGYSIYSLSDAGPVQIGSISSARNPEHNYLASYSKA